MITLPNDLVLNSGIEHNTIKCRMLITTVNKGQAIEVMMQRSRSKVTVSVLAIISALTGFEFDLNGFSGNFFKNSRRLVDHRLRQQCLCT